MLWSLYLRSADLNKIHNQMRVRPDQLLLTDNEQKCWIFKVVNAAKVWRQFCRTGCSFLWGQDFVVGD
jgi:hypothetical protein